MSANLSKQKKNQLIDRESTRQSKKKKPRPQKKTAPSKSVRMSKKRKSKLKKSKAILLELLGAVIITSGVLWMFSLFLFSFTRIEGYGMSPTLRDGDLVYVNKIAKIRTFDLVNLKKSGTNERDVRRVIGLPGQTITYKKDQLEINGEVREEKFILEEQQKAEENGRFFTEDLSILSLTGKTKIPEGKYLVLGDNRPYSNDSRSYGLIDAKEIIGVVEMRMLPLHQMGRF